VGVGGAGGVAGGHAAAEGEAGDRRLGHAGAGAVAGRNRGERRAAGRAAGVPAGDPLGVLLARTGLALSGGAAGAAVLSDAGLGRIEPVLGDVRALTHRARQRTRLAGAAAGGGAADPLGAVSGGALPAVRAEGADRLLAAGVGGADVAGSAVRVDGAGAETLAAVAGERGAGDRVGRDA